MLFYVGLLPESLLHLPYLPKKLRICANPTTQHGRQGGHVPIRGYATEAKSIRANHNPQIKQ